MYLRPKSNTTAFVISCNLINNNTCFLCYETQSSPWISQASSALHYMPMKIQVNDMAGEGFIDETKKTRVCSPIHCWRAWCCYWISHHWRKGEIYKRGVLSSEWNEKMLVSSRSTKDCDRCSTIQWDVAVMTDINLSSCLLLLLCNCLYYLSLHNYDLFLLIGVWCDAATVCALQFMEQQFPHAEGINHSQVVLAARWSHN